MKYSMYARFENGKVLEDVFLLRLYMTLYFIGLAYRDSCYNCKFSSAKRRSDITIGDFWQYEEGMGKKTDTDRGMSLMLVNTDKGMSVAGKMDEDDVYMEECDVDHLLRVQSTFGAIDKKTGEVDAFREDYKKHGIEYVLKKYAGYNSKGRVKHIVKNILTISGLMPEFISLRRK